MDIIHNLAFGFGHALTPGNLLYCAIGCVVGTTVGLLPGLGPLATISLLLPLTYAIPVDGALIMLAGIYYGANHAGSTTAIMLNMPGEPAAVVICFDGYPMAKQGRAGPALCMAALASFFAGCVCILVITFFAPMLGRAALKFGAPEYFSLLTRCSAALRKSIWA